MKKWIEIYAEARDAARGQPDRCTLHISKLDDFKKYLNSKGIAYRPGKGLYQVLQVQIPGKGWQCIFSRNNMPEHYTVQDKLMPLVRQYLNEKG